MNIQNRSEISKEDKWNLEKIYATLEDFNNDINKFHQELDNLVYLQKDFLNSSLELANFLKQDEKVSRLLEKLSVYANCKNDEDKNNSTNQELKGKIINLYAEYNEKKAAVIPRILKTDEKIINQYIEEQESLKSYKHFFDVIFSKKDHTLDESIEKVLSLYQPVFSSNSQTASYLTNADLNLGKIKDEDNNEIELTEANYSNYISSANRNIRR